MGVRGYLLLVDEGGARAHEIDFETWPGGEVGRPDDLKLGVARLVVGVRQPVVLTEWPHRSARVALMAIDDTFREQLGWKSLRLEYLTLKSREPINITGRSAELPVAILTYLDRLRSAQEALGETFPGIDRPFAATGELDDLGWVHPVNDVPLKVTAALKKLPHGSLMFYPEGNDSDVSPELKKEAKERFDIELIAVRRLHQALQQLKVPVVGWVGQPYRLLEPYRVDDQPIYFGRQKETETFCDALLDFERKADAEGAPGPSGLVEAASGTGKSSFVQAGVLARLRLMSAAQREPMQYAVWQPRQALLDVQVAGNEASIEEGAIARSVVRNWQKDEGGNATGFRGLEGATPETLTELLEAWKRAREPATRYVWVVDQLEELFTLNFSDEARLAFAVFLHELQQLKVWIIGTLRTEFGRQYQDLKNADGVSVLTKVFTLRKLDLTKLDGAALAQVINGPARVAGVRFEQRTGTGGRQESLEDVLFAAASRANAAPLIGYTMYELWQYATSTSSSSSAGGTSPELTFAGYYAIGGSDKNGIDGVLGKVAEDAINSESLDETARNALPQLLEALSVPNPVGGNDQELARPAKLALWPTSSPCGRLIQALEGVGLLKYDEGPDGKPEQVRVGHELLFKHWARARDYLKDAQEVRAFIERVKARSQDDLFTSAADLEGAAKIRKKLVARVEQATDRESDDAKALAFVDASIAAAERRKEEEQARHLKEIAKEKRARQRLAILSSILAFVGAAAIWFGHDSRMQRDAKEVALDDAKREGIAKDKALKKADEERLEAERQKQNADQQKSKADSERDRAMSQEARALAASANRIIDQGDPMSGILVALSVTSSGKGRPQTPEVNNALIRGLVQNREEFVVPITEKGKTEPSSCGATWTPDSQSFASIVGKNVVVWKIGSSPRRAATLVGHSATVQSVAYSPNGQFAVTTSDDASARIWTFPDDRPPNSVQLMGHTGPVNYAAISPTSSHVVTVSDDRSAYLWTVSNPRSGMRLDHPDTVEYVTFHPNGNMFATVASDGTIHLWTLGTSVARQRVLKAGDSTKVILRGIAFSPNGRLLAAGFNDGSVRIWELDSLDSDRVPRIQYVHRGPVSEVAFSPDSRYLASASADNTVSLSMIDGAPSQPTVLRGHTGPVFRLAFSPLGNVLASASSDGTIRLWRLDSGNESSTVLRGHLRLVCSIDFSPDGKRLASTSMDGTTRIWSVNSPRLSTVLTDHLKWVSDAAFDASGNRLITSSADGTVRFWKRTPDGWKSERLPTPEFGHNNGPVFFKCRFTRDGTGVVAISLDGHVMYWRLNSGNSPEVFSLKGHTSDVLDLSLSADGSYLGTASKDGTAAIWSLKEPTQSPTLLRGHSGAVYGIILGPDGQTAITVDESGDVRAWANSFGGKVSSEVILRMQDFGSKGTMAAGLAISGSGSSLAVAHGGNLVLVRTGKKANVVKLTDGDHDSIPDFSFSRDGKNLAVSRNDSVILWDVSKERPTDQWLRGNVSVPNRVAFSHDGKLLGVTGFDGLVEIWKLSAPEPLHISLQGHSMRIGAIAFNPNGREVVSGGEDATAIIWRVPEDGELIDLAQSQVTRCLTESQRRIFGLPPVLRAGSPPDTVFMTPCR